jgi:hypothetical protein
MAKWRALIFVFIVLLVFGIKIASAIEILAPVNKEVKNGDVIYVGAIGPGQTLTVLINPKVTTGGIFGKGGDYDNAIFTAFPEGWKAYGSKFYGRPLQVMITADKNAAEGDYFANITVIDEHGAEQLENITFTIKINVTWDVLNVDVSPEVANVGPSQPARIYITVTNKGTASDTFEITGAGVKRWDFTKNLYVAAGSSKRIVWELVGNEEETYNANIKVVSLSSPSIIKYEKNITVNVIPQSVLSDYKATNNGIIIFPLLENLVYSLAGLFSAFF